MITLLTKSANGRVFSIPKHVLLGWLFAALCVGIPVYADENVESKKEQREARPGDEVSNVTGSSETVSEEGAVDASHKDASDKSKSALKQKLLPYLERDENPESSIPFQSIDRESGPERASLQRYEQSRILPFFRQRAIDRGIILPWPFGVSVVGLYANEPIKLDSLKLKLPNGETIDAGEFSRLIEGKKTEIKNVSVRADFWLFPFLNLYGLLGKTEADLGFKIVGDLDKNFDQGRNAYVLGTQLVYGYGVLFGMIDFRYSQTDFTLSTDGAQNYTTIFRLGWNGTVRGVRGNIWIGALQQKIDLKLDVKASQFPVIPPPFDRAEAEIKMSSTTGFTPSIGTRWDIGKHWDVVVEGSFGDRDYVQGVLSYRF
ncbi:MAG: hypothetical protein AAGF35_05675 [Pseudomonadota bacterium]